MILGGIEIMKLEFKVTEKEGYNVMSFILETMKYKDYSIQFNRTKNIVVVQNIPSVEVGKVVQLLEEYYIIEGGTIEPEKSNEVGYSIQKNLERLEDVIIKEKKYMGVEDRKLVQALQGAVKEIQLLHRSQLRKIYPRHMYWCEFGTAFHGENYGLTQVLVLKEMADSCIVLQMNKVDEQIPLTEWLRMRQNIDMVYSDKGYEEDAVLFLESFVRVNKRRLVSSSIGQVTPIFFRNVCRHFAALLPTEGMTKEDTLTSELREIIEPAILQCYIRVSPHSKEEQIKQFLEIVHMPTDNATLQEVFLLCPTLEVVRWDTMIPKLTEMFPEKSPQSIKKELQQIFMQWLRYYPELAQKHGKIHFIQLLKVFAKVVLCGS